MVKKIIIGMGVGVAVLTAWVMSPLRPKKLTWTLLKEAAKTKIPKGDGTWV